MCNRAFAEAFRTTSFPSRRQILRSAAAATAGALACEAALPGSAQAAKASLQDLAGRFAQQGLPRVTIIGAREIITLDPDRSSATAVAVLGTRIPAVGSVEASQAAAGGRRPAASPT